ncbi:putative EF-hand domain pair protein [Medicago truncatula]|uniref:EF hand calcium-binding family protein n=1 Tax=Medicago truncatula TaxID=3880 RepID=G7KRQ4_MEDTR|nr:probable calcium-binding protein CML35 [Medicago truncatula]AES81273.1 EF hand calcium-binding family protein [Medicago truncatula]AFK35504.1 unknown [Medicago truncatula]RHN47778.1 putative EF-hand domain pair protein [Medicago truncatula]
MKFINPKNLSPKRLFRKKEKSSVSRSDPLSFGSSSSSDESLHKPITAGSQTPTSVLPEVSGEWSDITVDVQCELAQAFRLIDRDNDGVVSREELEAVLTRLGARPPTPEEIALMLSEVDSDGKGCISVETIMNRVGSGSSSGSDPNPEEELREAFEVFDTDRDGRISAEELLRVFRAIGDERCTLEECKRMIAGVDKNGDGFVCFQEFSLMMDLQR